MNVIEGVSGSLSSEIRPLTQPHNQLDHKNLNRVQINLFLMIDKKLPYTSEISV